VAARPRAKSRARSASVASTVAYDDTLRPVPKKRGRPLKNAPVVLPTEEDAMEHEEGEIREVRRRGKEIALQTRVATNIQKYARRPKAKAKPKSAAEPAVPSAAPPVKKLRIKKVAISSKPASPASRLAPASIHEKRGRGSGHIIEASVAESNDSRETWAWEAERIPGEEEAGRLVGGRAPSSRERRGLTKLFVL
jgi:hypothetical protein